MKVHLLAGDADVSSGAVAADLLLLSQLVQHRVLRVYSEVWVDSGSPDPAFWALDATSRLIYVHNARSTGSIKLTPDRLRWYADGAEDPAIDINATTLTGSRSARVTFVLLEPRDGKTLKVLNAHNNTVVKPEQQSGWWRHQRWTIVNTAANQAWDWSGQPTEQAVHEANALGIEMMCRRVPTAVVLDTARDMTSTVEITSDDLANLAQVQGYAAQVSSYMRSTAESVRVNGRELAGV